MRINPLASGSTGNCYLIDDGKTKLLLEAGISWKKIQKALNYKTSDIAAVVGSHGHGDHLGHAKEAMKAGIDVFCSQAAANMAQLDGHRLNIIEADKQFNIGTWTIRAFDVLHDVENLGFILANENNERLLYLTDTPYVTYRFSGLTHIMVECNYCGDILSANIQKGNIHKVIGKRVRRNHMSLDTVIGMIKANDLSVCCEIWLLHLSDRNSNENEMRRKIQEATGVATYIASTTVS